MTTIGALNKYVHDYTKCVDGCDFYNTDKTKRLGYDNTVCLLKCNDYFTRLRKNNLPSRSVYFLDSSLDPTPINKSNTCQYLEGEKKLKCLDETYQRDLCKKQCYLNESFFSPYRMKVCLRLCDT
jgi:hypothetical protein